MNVGTPNDITVFSIPYMPPSSNQIYVNKRGGGGRFLSTLAEQYKATVKSYLGEHYMMDISNLNPEGMYEVTFNFLLSKDQVFNKGFGKEKNGAKTKYKRIDASNRIKLLEDCIKEVTGIDDSQYFSVTARKWIAKEPRVVIYLEEMELAEVDADIFAKSVLQNLS